MTFRKTLIALALFSSGALVGSQFAPLVTPAQADEVKWAEVAQNPSFRAAVIEVINSCIVDNGIIFCN